MRRIRFLVLGLVSFVAAIFGALLVPGTWVNRVFSTLVCGIFSFNSMVCTANWGQSSQRVVAATPPAVENTIFNGFSDLLAQRDPSEFGDPQPSTPSPQQSNPQAPPFPQDPGPNFPVRPEFDSPRQNVSVSGREFQSGNTKVREIRPKTFEVAKVTPEGCQVTRVLNASGNRPYIESVKFDPLNSNTCATGSYLFRFQPDGRRVEVQVNPNDTLIFEITTDQTARLTYKNLTGQSEVYEVNYRKKSKTDFKSLNIDQKIAQLSTKPKNSFNTNLVIANVDNIIADLSCGICESIKTAWDLTFGETSVDVKNASLLDDLLSLLKPSLPSKLMFLVNQFLGNLPKIEEALQKTTDLGINCEKITVADQQFSCDDYSRGQRAGQNEGERLGRQIGQEIIEQQPQKAAVSARISQIDDVATIYVDGRRVKEGGYAPGGKGGDTGWGPIDVSSGKHQVRLVVNNTLTGGSGGWFEIKVNGQLKINQGRKLQEDRITGIKYDQTTTLEVP